jgi:hypothetical protein
MRVRLTQLDGKLPNLALMKLAHWHRARGDELTFTRRADRDMFEPEYDVVYGSAIFTRTAPTVARFRAAWPDAILGGTWSDDLTTVEALLGVPSYELFDYSLYPAFEASIGYTQRGCRMKCHFCAVPKKEPGRPWNVNTIAQLWRGPGHPKKLHLIDNDFFGGPEWRDRVAEIREGGFRVCLNQGFNVRLITEEAAAAIASVEYRDDSFRERKLYVAWDNLGDERVFFRGVDRLAAAGVPPTHLRSYMLVGFAPDETWEAVEYRFQRMVALGIEPYPMVHDAARARDPEWYHKLKEFQRWTITGLYRARPFSEYRGGYNRARVARRESERNAPGFFDSERVA